MWHLFEASGIRYGIHHHSHASTCLNPQIPNQLIQIKNQSPTMVITAVSSPLLGQWRQWVSFWKALIEIYRLSVYWAWSEDFFQIFSVKNGSRKWPAARNPAIYSQNFTSELKSSWKTTIWPPLESSLLAESINTTIIIAIKILNSNQCSASLRSPSRKDSCRGSASSSSWWVDWRRSQKATTLRL